MWNHIKHWVYGAFAGAFLWLFILVVIFPE